MPDLSDRIALELAEIVNHHTAAGCHFTASVPALAAAVGAALVHHAPDGAGSCCECRRFYPCRTVTAAARALGLTDAKES